MPQSTAHAPDGEQPRASGGSPGAGRLLQQHLMAGPDELFRPNRQECHTVLVRFGFGGDADFHAVDTRRANRLSSYAIFFGSL